MGRACINRPSTVLLLLSVAMLLIASCGCAALGVAASVIPQNVKARYPGLQGQSVGIMVWADRGVAIDWNSVQLDLANAVEAKLTSANTEETKGITWPYPPASYVRWFRDHPGTESLPLTEIAPRLGVKRLI